MDVDRLSGTSSPGGSMSRSSSVGAIERSPSGPLHHGGTESASTKPVGLLGLPTEICIAVMRLTQDGDPWDMGSIELTSTGMRGCVVTAMTDPRMKYRRAWHAQFMKTATQCVRTAFNNHKLLPRCGRLMRWIPKRMRSECVQLAVPHLGLFFSVGGLANGSEFLSKIHRDILLGSAIPLGKNPYRIAAVGSMCAQVEHLDRDEHSKLIDAVVGRCEQAHDIQPSLLTRLIQRWKHLSDDHRDTLIRASIILWNQGDVDAMEAAFQNLEPLSEIQRSRLVEAVVDALTRARSSHYDQARVYRLAGRIFTAFGPRLALLVPSDRSRLVDIARRMAPSTVVIWGLFLGAEHLIDPDRAHVIAEATGLLVKSMVNIRSLDAVLEHVSDPDAVVRTMLDEEYERKRLTSIGNLGLGLKYVGPLLHESVVSAIVVATDRAHAAATIGTLAESGGLRFLSQPLQEKLLDFLIGLEDVSAGADRQSAICTLTAHLEEFREPDRLKIVTAATSLSPAESWEAIARLLAKPQHLSQAACDTLFTFAKEFVPSDWRDHINQLHLNLEALKTEETANAHQWWVGSITAAFIHTFVVP